MESATVSTVTPAGEPADFERAFTALEETVQALESGNLPLEEAIALFERGMSLAGACTACLDAAELRLKQLVPAPDGSYEAEDWNPSEL